MPVNAVPFRVEDAAALAWRGLDGIDYVLHRGGGQRLGLSIAESARFPDAAAILAGIASGTPPAHPAGALLRLPETREPDPIGPSDRREALEILARGLDAPSWLAADACGLTRPEAVDWFAGRPDRIAFARTHPWLAAALFSGFEELDPDATRLGPDGAGHAVLEAVLGRPAGPDAEAALARMRGFVLPQALLGAADTRRAEALLAMPADLFPPPLPPDLPAADPAQQAYLALYVLAAELTLLSRVSGRPLRSILGGRPTDWGTYVADLAARTGLSDVPDDFPGEWGAILAQDCLHEIFDMVRSFAGEVLAPALALLGGRWMGPVAEGGTARTLSEAARDPVTRAALILLLGERTLRRLAETCGRWHARADAIAREAAALCGGASEGPCLFPDADVGDACYLTSLHRVKDLLDEGADAPDAAGVPGLAHCVGGYGREVVSGRTAIVSLRRRRPDGGYERIGTAQVDFSTAGPGNPPRVIQASGHRNARLSAEAKACLALGIATVARDARSALEAYRPVPRDWPRTDEAVAAAGIGAWERMRDLWAFALPRPLRDLDPEGLLAAAGLDVPVRGESPAP